jgi:hypothetical protein
VHSQRIRNAEIDLAGGYGRIRFDSLGSQPRIVGRASVRYRFSNDWIGRIGANHLTSADLLGNSALESTGSIGVEKRFEEGRSAVGVNLFLTRYDSDSLSSGPNLFGGAEVELRRQLTRRTQFRISYRYWGNQGDYEADDMQQNRLLVELNVRY